MSTRLLPVKLPNGSVVKMEVDVGETDVAAPFEDFREAMALDALQDAIQGVAELVTNALKKVKPQKIAVEFAVELGYEAGKLTALILKGAMKGSLKITLEWSEDRARKPSA